MGRIRFKKKTRVEQEIPTGPMADISFLLIIFFMVTTTFVVYRGIIVDLPDASQIDVMKSKRNVVSVWVAADGRMMVDEFHVTLKDIGSVVIQKLQENPRVIIQIKADKSTPYRQVSGVIEELKMAGATRVSFITRTSSDDL